MARFSLVVNGAPKVVDAAPDTPLLWILRDDLALTGTKFGCGEGLCGACTVLLDGEPVRSCQTAVSAVGARRVTTIEGLSAKGDHPLQKAWVEDEVPQCGYCQSGQLLAAAALLRKTPHPTDAQIDVAMDGLLCRCGTYQRIRRAIRRVEGGRP